MASETPAQQEEHQHKEGFGSVLAGFFGEHKTLLVGGIIGVAIVAFIMSKSQNASNAGTTGAVNQQGDLGAAGAQSNQTATALTNLQTQLDNLRNTLGTIAQGPPGPAGPTGPTGPQGSPGTTGILPTSNWSPPLIPYSQTWSGKHYFPVAPGHRFDWQGVSYWITSNANGVIQGVPGATSAGQAAGKGTVVLYAPASAYQKPVLNPLANHSPVYNFMALGQTSGGMDLGQPSAAGNSMAIRPVSHVGHAWSEGIGASGSDSTYVRRQ